MQAAELLTSEDFYFITSPTVMTIAEKYLWINNRTFVSKGVDFNLQQLKKWAMLDMMFI